MEKEERVVNGGIRELEKLSQNKRATYGHILQNKSETIENEYRRSNYVANHAIKTKNERERERESGYQKTSGNARVGFGGGE